MKTLTIKDISTVLNRYLSGELDEAQLIAWADRHECQEDVEYDPQHATVIAAALFELATPEINGALTVGRVHEIRDQLMSN